MVKGDIFSALMEQFCTLLAIPLTSIYNEIANTHIWPAIWKKEYVTVIPKCRTPTSMGDLRNISCTMLPSKIYESFVLNWLLLDNEAIELEFILVLIYYTYMRKLEREESMMCRNDKSRVGPKWKTQQTSFSCVICVKSKK